VISRHNIDGLADLARYLREGVGNRERNLRETDGDQAAELRGEIRAFRKVLQILDEQFNVR
jgi:hypothetical protein